MVRTIQGLVFLIAIIFYLYVDEPQKRDAFLARFGRGSTAGQAGGSGSAPVTGGDHPMKQRED